MFQDCRFMRTICLSTKRAVCYTHNVPSPYKKLCYLSSSSFAPPVRHQDSGQVPGSTQRSRPCPGDRPPSRLRAWGLPYLHVSACSPILGDSKRCDRVMSAIREPRTASFCLPWPWMISWSCSMALSEDPSPLRGMMLFGSWLSSLAQISGFTRSQLLIWHCRLEKRKAPGFLYFKTTRSYP